MNKLQPLGNDKGLRNKEYNKAETVQDALSCLHAFEFKGTRIIECKKCGWGLQVDSLEEFNKINDYYARRNAE